MEKRGIFWLILVFFVLIQITLALDASYYDDTPDSDSDDLDDDWENYYFSNLNIGADTNSDLDCLTNLQEYTGWLAEWTDTDGVRQSRYVYSDPTESDTDGDGKDDCEERIHALDPTDSDTNDDGTIDGTLTAATSGTSNETNTTDTTTSGGGTTVVTEVGPLTAEEVKEDLCESQTSSDSAREKEYSWRVSHYSSVSSFRSQESRGVCGILLDKERSPQKTLEKQVLTLVLNIVNNHIPERGRIIK